MKTIKLSAVIGLFFINFLANAQSEECKQSLSLFVESAKAKNYDVCYEHWKKVYDSAPNINYAVYAYANKIIKAQIRKASSESKKKELLNLLSEVYDKGHKYFPKKIHKANVYENKALLMYDYKTGGNEEVFELLDKGFKSDKIHFSNPKAMYLYFSSLVNLHKEKKRNLQLVFDTYDNVMERIEIINQNLLKKQQTYIDKEKNGSLSSRDKKILTNARKTIEVYGRISYSIDTKMGQLSDCKNLEPLYSKNYEAKKDDIVWLKRAAARMDNKGCTDKPLFAKLVERLHSFEPSAESAYYIGFLKDKQGKEKESLKFYNEAVSLHKDNYKKAKILLRIASKYKLKNKNKTAYNYAKKALSFSPTYGKAYLIIASAYADSANECGNSTFEKRAMYWKAADVAKKSGKIDPSLKSVANKVAKSYNQRAPQKSDIFESGLEGKSITFSCWVGGSIKVPKLK